MQANIRSQMGIRAVSREPHKTFHNDQEGHDGPMGQFCEFGFGEFIGHSQPEHLSEQEAFHSYNVANAINMYRQLINEILPRLN